jgi:flavin reductase (DIM6/NTAB) family NADH-FMN oxidoreductase RutF
MRPVAPDHFRAVMGRFVTGVTIVTARGPDGPVGLTANAVCSLSLDPLLLLVCFDRSARTLPVIEETGRFGVNVLATGQEGLATQFAGKASFEEKFRDVPYSEDAGIPVLEGVHAWVGCELDRLIDGGDHIIGIGSVFAAELGAGDPLAFHQGTFSVLTP